MQFCTSCGRRRADEARFCTGCGQPFPDAGTAAGSDTGPGEAGRDAATPLGTQRPPSRRPFRLAIVALIVVVLVGGGTASALVLTRHHAHPPAGQAAGNTTPSSTPARPSTSPAAPSAVPVTPATIPATQPPSPTPSGPAGGNPGNGQVAAAASIAEDPQEPQVLGFLDSYFAAINSHSYHDYRALLNPAEADALTYTQFQHGYGSTTDSAERLLGISPDANGETIAKVAFTSHQNAASSVDGSQTCTRWRVLLYLQQDGDGYLLGTSPPGYRASYAAC